MQLFVAWCACFLAFKNFSFAELTTSQHKKTVSFFCSAINFT